MKIKINEDRYYTTSANTVLYSIQNNGNTIFNGKAYKNPNSNLCSINVTKICRDWVSNHLPDYRNIADSALSQTEAFQQFDFYTYSVSGTSEEQILIPELRETYQILFAWDYDMAWSGQSCTLSNPINGKMDNRMKLLYSVYRDTTGETICYDVKKYPKISVTPKFLHYTNSASTQNVTVISNIPFVALTDESWITVSPSSSSSGTTVLNVTVTLNDYELERNGVVKIKYHNDILEIFEYINIPVYQEPAEEYIRMSATATQVPSTQNNQIITVTSNTKWYFEIQY